MSTVTAQSAPKQHVPAWKRLGLKLKYARDTADEPTTQLERDDISSNKRPLAGDEEIVVARPQKKRKATKEASRATLSSPPPDDSPHVDVNTNRSIRQSLEETAATSHQRKKARHQRLDGEE